jgi:hypothetical protein
MTNVGSVVLPSELDPVHRAIRDASRFVECRGVPSCRKHAPARGEGGSAIAALGSRVEHESTRLEGGLQPADDVAGLR